MLLTVRNVCVYIYCTYICVYLYTYIDICEKKEKKGRRKEGKSKRNREKNERKEISNEHEL